MDEKKPTEVKEMLDRLDRQIEAYTERKVQRKITPDELQAMIHSLQECRERGELSSLSALPDTDTDPFW